MTEAIATRSDDRVQLPDSAITDLSKGFDGPIIGPSHEAYDAARHCWNGMVEKFPALIAQPRGTADVAAAIRFARKHGLEISVRCGGHGSSGQSVTDGGLVIDLALMRGVRVDPAARRAWVQGGALLRDVDREAQVHGLATTGGVVSHTGVGGLTLGGGYGYLGRRFGLACDNVRSAEVVTAAGDVLVAGPDRNEDLYWGIRGGGGNFGVVTMFEFELHPFGPDILSVDLAYPIDRGPAALRAFFDLAAGAPDPMVGGAAVVTARPSPDIPAAHHGRPIVWVGYTYADDVEAGKRHVSRLKAVGEPLVEAIEVMRYVDLQRMPDEVQRHGLRQYARSHFIRATTDDFIEALLDRGGADASIAPGGSLGQLGGAISRVGPEETAFSGRDALFDLVVTATWEDPALDADRIAAARAFGDTMQPLSTGRSYVNAIDDPTTDRVRAAFGPATYERLVAVKDRYDPENVFHLNQNVRPTGRA